MNKLELKHLAPYLPYSLKYLELSKGTSYNDPDVRHIREWKINDVEALFNKRYRIISTKPILRPLSDLTKPITVNGETFVPNDYFYKHWFIRIRHDGFFSLDLGDGTANGFTYQGAPYNLIQQLLEWHFDVFNLIEQNLALDINTLEK